MKDSAIMYRSFLSGVETLPPERQAEAYRAYFAYAMDGTGYSGGDPVITALLATISSQIDKDRENYESFRASRVDNGRRGGRPKASVETEETEQNLKNLDKAKKASDVDVDVDENVDADENNNMHSSEKMTSASPAPAAAPPSKTDIDAVEEAWNSLSDTGVKPVTRILQGTVRHRMLTARIAQHGLPKVLEAVGRIRGSDFLTCRTDAGFLITFDWFVKPNNFVKVLEGNYDSKPRGRGRDSPAGGHAYNAGKLAYLDEPDYDGGGASDGGTG